MFKRRGCRSYIVELFIKQKVEKEILNKKRLTVKEEVTYKKILGCTNAAVVEDLGKIHVV